MSKWRYGCGKQIEVAIPKGWDYKVITVECGGTAVDGSVNQCEDCAEKIAQSRVPEYGNIESEDGE